jgi:hypothetical protein
LCLQIVHRKEGVNTVLCVYVIYLCQTVEVAVIWMWTTRLTSWYMYCWYLEECIEVSKLCMDYRLLEIKYNVYGLRCLVYAAVPYQHLAKVT